MVTKISSLINKNLIKNFSSEVGKFGKYGITCGGCGKVIDIELFKKTLNQREGFSNQLQGCKEAKKELKGPTKYSIKENECKITDLIARFGPFAMSRYNDTRLNSKYAQVFFEAINETPKSGIDWTGDHGTKVVPFIKELVKDETLEESVGLIDVGGLNPHTINLFDPDGEKQHTIVDVNMLTPIVNKEQDNIRYEITDAEDFAQESASSEMERIRNGTNKPICIVMNNFLNAVPPEKGLATITKFYDAMSKGDQMIISGLPKERLEKDSSLESIDNGKGLVKFQQKSGDFYRTAINPKEFVQTLQKFDGASIKKDETFPFDPQGKFMGVRFAIVKE